MLIVHPGPDTMSTADLIILYVTDAALILRAHSRGFYLQDKTRAGREVQNWTINYIHAETPPAENDHNNDYKRFK